MENALLILFKNPTATRDAIERLSKDILLWQRLIIDGRNFVQKNITWDIYGREMIALFEPAFSKADLQLER